jgi:phytoene dehydrogenase-like protein
MDVLGRELGLVWPARREPVAWQYRTAGFSVDLTSSRREIISRFPDSAAFWKEQSVLAKLLWRLSSGGLPWPVAVPRDLVLIVRKGLAGFPGTARLLQFASRTVHAWLADHGLGSDADFVRFIDSQLLISAQTVSRHANALSAAIALDLPVSGAWQVAGGIGTVSELLSQSIRRSGGSVLCGREVIRINSIRRDVLGVETSAGEAFAADVVLANMTPCSLAVLTCADAPAFREGDPPGWSAFMLYLCMESGAFERTTAHHLQIVEPEGPLGEGRSIFVSASPADDAGRAPEGCRAVTVSTHTRPAPWFEAREKGRDVYLERKELYTRKVLGLLSAHLPDAEMEARFLKAATPLTWQRYTGRFHGYVGGYPQTSLFDVRGPVTAFRNLFLVGDSVFPGQSLPGVVTGARRVVELVLRQFGKNGG